MAEEAAFALGSVGYRLTHFASGLVHVQAYIFQSRLCLTSANVIVPVSRIFRPAC